MNHQTIERLSGIMTANKIKFNKQFTSVLEHGFTDEARETFFEETIDDLDALLRHGVNSEFNKSMKEAITALTDLAVKAGFDGLKMICSDYYPGDQRAMDVLEKAAGAGLPVLFHSGIVWDGMESAKYNRPGNFEALIEIPKLRFCLAHMSWPWCDECFAVYGKFNNAYARRPDMSCEMFIDVTPGTPRPYREEVLRHMIWTEYEYRYNVMFGTDCSANDYNIAWAKEWQTRDDAIYEKLVENDVEDFKEHVYYKNVMRFLGKSDEDPRKYIPMPGV
jgi:predicted TIM-barrel fold metal-dependent hydrolase